MSMKILGGFQAFPAFRLHQIKAACSALFSKPVTLEATFLYLLDLAEPLTPTETVRACELLGATEQPAESAADPTALFVSPRKGTISPWSTKATDIFKNCGFTHVRRIERAIQFHLFAQNQPLLPQDAEALFPALHDRMTEGVYTDLSDLFTLGSPTAGLSFDVLSQGASAIEKANVEQGLALSADEIEYLTKAYQNEGKNPTDTELVMFGQVNSEHCRHKIFNAEWIIDGKKQDLSLFKMIKNTHQKHPQGTLVAYSDNSGIMEGYCASLFFCDPTSHHYTFCQDQIDILMKVETHNHPTAISPFPGAATGVGGEIRDEASTGTGSKTRAGIAGFMTSHLHIPGYALPWESTSSKTPPRLASALQIMTEGPIGGAAFGNEFGRPQLCGFFRTFEAQAHGTDYGYHKPIMLAGGMGTIRRGLVHKQPIPAGSLIVQLGGPAMRIGLGGGAASSLASGSNDEDLDFNSVQRGNAEMQRRCQEVIDACVALGDQNPILSIHDIGAGGLSNGCPELVEKTGGHFDLRAVHNEEPSMSPMEIWCCEAQERYVLAIAPESRAAFEALCQRERCPVAFIGVATDDHRLVLSDDHFQNRPIDMNIDVLLGKPPRMLRDVSHVEQNLPPVFFQDPPAPAEALERVLRHPAVADKTFLISITDRTVTGMVHRDQMCGPYQLPIADHAITMLDYTGTAGSAMACGERTPIAVSNAPASGRLAVTEAILNLATAAVGDLGRVKLSANWMCACGEPGEDANLFDTVQSVGLDFCPALGLSIPVGKDSLSMRTLWEDPQTGASRHQISPLSLIVSAFAPVDDVQLSVTPDVKPQDSVLLLADLSNGQNRLGGSILSQVYNCVGGDVPDADDPARILAFWNVFQDLLKKHQILAAHDRSDGGLVTTLVEMCMGGGRGCCVSLPAVASPQAALAQAFCEEPGMVMQVAAEEAEAIQKAFSDAGVCIVPLGKVTETPDFRITTGSADFINLPISTLRGFWSENSIQMRALRDNPACAEQERQHATDANDPGLTFHLTFDPDAIPSIQSPSTRPTIAILREQGVNGHVEMAAAFALAGFESIDVHMTDLLNGDIDLSGFKGLVACGGFSYGDVLGAGSGWARSILYNNRLKDSFEAFFQRPDTFTLGVCNGCQMVSQLKNIIPGAENWPRFVHNVSEQFEARYCTLEVLDSPAVLLKGMQGSRLPIAVAHGEGFAQFDSQSQQDALVAQSNISLRYVDGRGNPTESYPYNPNGSAQGFTGFCSSDGRALILMPHPERGFRAAQLSYRPTSQFTGEAGPWMRMFRNARAFVN